MLPDEALRFRIAHAIRDALPTRLHAEMLLEQAADLLGPAARLERSGGGTRIKLFRTGPVDPEQVAPWPLLELALGERLDVVITPDGEPAEIPTRPGRAPKGRGQGPGQLKIHAHQDEISLVYGSDGRWSEVVNARRPEWFEKAVEALAAKSGSPVELLAGFVASLEPGLGINHGGLYVPTPFPQGFQGLWNLGRRQIAREVFENVFPETAWFAAADALGGGSLAFGGTRAEAVRAVRAQIAALRPWLPREEAPDAEIEALAAEPGVGAYRTPAVDVPMPPRDPANVPIAVVAFHFPPDEYARFGDWRPFVAASGYVRWHYFRTDADGWTVFGKELEIEQGVRWIRERTAAEDARLDAEPPPPLRWPDSAPPLRMAIRTYRFVRLNESGAMGLEASDAWVHDLQPWELDGDAVMWQVVRMRWIRE